jgi:hypothetical protein
MYSLFEYNLLSTTRAFKKFLIQGEGINLIRSDFRPLLIIWVNSHEPFNTIFPFASQTMIFPADSQIGRHEEKSRTNQNNSTILQELEL